MKISQKVKIDLKWSTLGSLVGIIAEVIKLLIILFLVNPAVYGEFIVIFSISMIYAGILKTVPEGIISDEEVKISKYIINQYYVLVLLMLSIFLFIDQSYFVALLVFFSSFSSVSRALLRRKLVIKKIIISNIISSLFSSIMIALFSYYKEVQVETLIYLNAFCLFLSELYILQGKNILIFREKIPSLKEMKFGLIRSLESLVLSSFRLGDKVLLSSFIDADNLANYAMGSNLGRKFDEKLLPIINNVAFPHLAKARREHKLSESKLRDIAQYLYFVSLTLSLSIYVIFEKLFRTLVISNYSIETAIITLSMIYGSLHVYENLFKHYSLALNRPDKVLVYNGTVNAVSLGLLVVFLNLDWSICNILRVIVLGRIVLALFVSRYLAKMANGVYFLSVSIVLAGGLAAGSSVVLLSLVFVLIIKLYRDYARIVA